MDVAGSAMVTQLLELGDRHTEAHWNMFQILHIESLKGI